MKLLSALLAALTAALVLIPHFADANSGDFSGGVAVGSSYAGAITAPTNGLAVQGNVGIGTSSPAQTLEVNGVAQVDTSIILNGNELPLPPGGRLTLTSNTPVMTADATGATTIYYADMSGDLVPVYTGAHWQAFALGGQLSLALDSNSGHTGYQQSGKLFDVFAEATRTAGVVELVTGPAWTNTTTRASALSLKNGIWTNTSSMTVKYDATSSTYSCPANQCTYLGTIYATANGQTGWSCKPAGANGGGGAILGVYNAYNRLSMRCSEVDNTSWTYNAAVWRDAHNSANNRIYFVDGLQQSSVGGNYMIVAADNTFTDSCYVAVGIDGGNGNGWSITQSAVAGNYQTVNVSENYYPVLGYHYLSPRENVAAGACTFTPGNTQMIFNLVIEGI